MTVMTQINTLRPRQNGCHFPDNIFKCIFLNEEVWIAIKISLKFVRKSPVYNIPALVQIMAWRRPREKPLSEPMMVSLRRIYMLLCLDNLKHKSDFELTKEKTLHISPSLVSWGMPLVSKWEKIDCIITAHPVLLTRILTRITLNKMAAILLALPGLRDIPICFWMRWRSAQLS